MLETTTYSHVWTLVATLVVAVPAIIAIVATLRSRSLRLAGRLLWVILLLVPVVGIIAWLVVRPTGFTFSRRRHASD